MKKLSLFIFLLVSFQFSLAAGHPLSNCLSQHEIENEKILQKNMWENFKEMRACILAKDIDCTASYIMMNATTINYDAPPAIVITSKSFLALHYNKIFSTKVIRSLQNQKEQDLQYFTNGAMIGTGQLWLDYVSDEAALGKYCLKIYVINP